jgi:hypothetical protein
MAVTVAIDFTRLLQDSQEAGSTDEHMVSRVYFDLSIGDRKEGSFYVDVKQTVGAPMSADAIEVSPIRGYKGPMSYDAFAREVRAYFLACVGPTASGIRISPGAANIRMRNNVFAMRRRVLIDVPDQREGSW